MRNISMPLNFYLQPHIQQMIKKLRGAHRQHKVVVLASGVFDLFHQEHENYLRAAKKAGDILVVAIESNARARELKGKNRPVHDEAKRLTSVLDISEVDYAFILPEDFHTKKAYEEL
ncbi:MAG: adenylyltransferase/cytidyltransferase family protein, partial [Patescibacteria group bacterium]